MNNTTEINNFERQNLKATSFVLAFIAIIFLLPVFIISMVITKNCNGEVRVVEVTVNSVTLDDDTNKLIDENGTKYNIGSLSDEIDWESYVGKTVTIITPFEQFSGDPWILGLVDDGNIVIDYNKTLTDRRTENTIIVIVFACISGALFIASAVFYMIFRKKPKTKTANIDDCIWEVFASNLPKSPKRKTLVIPSIVMVVALLLLAVVMSAIGDKVSETVNIVVASIMGGIIFVSLATMFWMSYFYLPKDEIKFYKKNYPFNSDDISHQPMKKSIKQEMMAKLKAERLARPDDFFDMGNGLNAIFTNEGLILRAEDFDNELEVETQGVFDEFDNPDARSILFEYVLPYEKLNFVAIPKYRKHANMFGVIIKSRLDGAESYPNEISIDIHFLLDSNLLTTLRKFNIEVEGLDYILNNVEKLMKENCPKAKSGLKQPNKFI